MDRRPIQDRIGPDQGDGHEGPGLDPDAFREALSRWASAVTVVAARDGDAVHATTVSSFIPVSAEPPLVLVSLGANAQVLPWLDPGARFAVSFLATDQRRLASVFADPFPVGPSPVPAEGDPVVEGALGALICTVRDVLATGSDARLVLALVESASLDAQKEPLVRYRRSYRTLAPEE